MNLLVIVSVRVGRWERNLSLYRDAEGLAWYQSPPGHLPLVRCPAHAQTTQSAINALRTYLGEPCAIRIQVAMDLGRVDVARARPIADFDSESPTLPMRRQRRDTGPQLPRWDGGDR